MDTTPTTTPTPPTIAVLLTPGMGHLIPLVEFSKKLHHHHNFNTTLIIPTTNKPLPKPEKDFLSSLPPFITYLLLPPVNFDDLPVNARNETRTALIIPRSLPSIRDAVRSLHSTNKLSAFFVDVFGTDGFEVALEFGIPPYIFFTSTAMVLSFVFNLPNLDETVSCEFGDLPEKLRIPGCVPIDGRDLLSPVLDRKNDAYKWVLYHAKRYSMAEGILVNSFNEVESGAIEYLLQKEIGKPIVYPIGPLVQMDSKSEKGNKESSVYLEWLDHQPIKSVLYVSFGSQGVLSHDQLIELALGLEMSGARFLWVVRCPRDYKILDEKITELTYLPDGFVDRTRGRGLVVPDWAPQARILAHESTGAFVTHCGWNSTLESLVNGVPLIAWPLYAEQSMNAVLLHEDVKVALRPKVGENGLVGREEVASVVKYLMGGEEGKGIKRKASELKEAAKEVLSENGSSTKALAELAAKWKSNASII